MISVPPPLPPEPAIITYEAVEEPEWSQFTATAYTADCHGCIGITKSGIDVRDTQIDAKGRVIIAVDPSVIALGTALEIRLADGSIYEAVAEDIGGDIKGARIDVLMATVTEAREFGRQDVEVRTINDKGAD